MKERDDRRRYAPAAWVLAGGILLAVLLALRPTDGGSVAATDSGGTDEAPAHVEEIEGTDLHEITLTDEAATRIDLQTSAATTQRTGGRESVVVPYSALLYDPFGGTWVYVSTDELVFRRAAVRVQRIVGDEALLRRGLDAGSEVVTVAAAELWGAEFGVGH